MRRVIPIAIGVFVVAAAAAAALWENAKIKESVLDEMSKLLKAWHPTESRRVANVI